MTALASAPNNWDSMVYHLARIPYWIQQSHVAHFPSHVTSQLIMSPLSEYAMMHSMLLTGGDSFVNLVQWFSGLGSVIAVSLIAKHLKFSPKVQVFSALLASASPMLLMQASSTQNDLVNALFLLSTLVFILKYKSAKKASDILFIALSAGLALLTKGTAYIYLLPMAIWFMAIFLKSKEKSSKVAIAGLVMILLINCGHWHRNYSVFSHPLGMDTTSLSYYHPRGIASNLVRNTLMECATDFKVINEFIGKVSYKLHQVIGIDQNDPRTTWSGSMSYEMRPLRLQEDYASNPIHMLLFGLSLLYILFFLSKGEVKNILYAYAACIIIAFILFSSLLEWQIWHNRLHLPFILMTVPISAFVLSKFRIVSYISLSLIFLYGDILKDWNRISEECSDLDIKNLGVIGSATIWDYPTWLILNKDQRFYIENIEVKNSSSTLENSEFKPDVILGNKVRLEENINYKGSAYKKSIQSGELSVYTLEEN